MEEKYKGFTPDYIETLLPKQIFVFGSNALGYHDEEIAQFFVGALELKNVSLPKSFVDALGGGETNYDLERFVEAQRPTAGTSRRAPQNDRGCCPASGSRGHR